MSSYTDNLLARPLDHLKDMIAATSHWQAWTGSASAAASKAFIHCRVLRPDTLAKAEDPDEWADIMPYCIIDMDATPTRTGAGTNNTYATERTAVLSFFAPTDALLTGNSDSDDAMQTFMDHVGQVVGEMLALSGTGGHLDIASVEMSSENFQRISEREYEVRGDCHLAEISMEISG